MKMTPAEIREFYDSPLEPERQRLLARYLQLVAALQSESADPALVLEHRQTKRELLEINAQMQADYRVLKFEQARAATRAEEIRQQLEGGVTLP